MKALQVRIRKVARGDIDRIIDIEHHVPPELLQSGQFPRPGRIAMQPHDVVAGMLRGEGLLGGAALRQSLHVDLNPVLIA